jgi:hypothetical protein
MAPVAKLEKLQNALHGLYDRGLETSHVARSSMWFPGRMVQERGFLWYDGHVVDYSHYSILWTAQDPMQVYHLTFSHEVYFESVADHFDSLP